ncbi:MAG: cytochrome P460 family protein [Gammaproteobacteria bacterium]
MKRLSLLIALFIGATAGLTGNVSAAECKPGKNPAQMSHAEMRAHYDCFRPGLAAGYQKRGKNPIAMAYTDWQAASTAPAAPGFHSGQHLMTYVNPLGYASYVAFQAQGANMPAGTLIAKENFSFKKNGKLKKGPLLMMEKVGLDAAPDTGGWIYSGVKPNGKKLKVDQKGFCHACHQAWPGQDFLGYPIPAVRVSSGY